MSKRRTWKRPWTAVEDAAIRRSTEAGHPTLRALAVDCGRSYFAIRTRASRLGSIRLQRVDLALRPAPSTRPCEYCGAVFVVKGSARHCGLECRYLGKGRCPGCGQALTDLQCLRCAADRKRSEWPGKAAA